MNVLSLFDGMSCGQIALERAGIKVDKYYASEIDKHAIKVTMSNYPNTIQLGSVTQIKGDQFERIGLLIGGSPCQGFSFAGKQLNFEDPRSKLFFEYVRILKELREKNPDIKFLLENVKMKKEYQDIISRELGVEPVLINSSLVSAQNRRRLYWTNIGEISQPEDKKILLRDILQREEFSEITAAHKNRLATSTDIPKGFSVINPDKAICMTARKFANYKGTYIDQSKIKSSNKTENYLQYDLTGKGHKSQDQRAYFENKKHGSLPALGAGTKVKVLLSDTRIRKLTPVECERLQTVPDNYTAHVSDSQRYRMLGNGWTIDVIVHILKSLL